MSESFGQREVSKSQDYNFLAASRDANITLPKLVIYVLMLSTASSATWMFMNILCHPPSQPDNTTKSDEDSTVLYIFFSGRWQLIL